MCMIHVHNTCIFQPWATAWCKRNHHPVEMAFNCSLWSYLSSSLMQQWVKWPLPLINSYSQNTSGIPKDLHWLGFFWGLPTFLYCFWRWVMPAYFCLSKAWPLQYLLCFALAAMNGSESEGSDCFTPAFRSLNNWFPPHWLYLVLFRRLAYFYVHLLITHPSTSHTSSSPNICISE